MAKYIYYNKELRCRIKYVKWLNHYECQLQKSSMCIFWINIRGVDGFRLDLKEGFWGEDWPPPFDRNPLRSSYQMGGHNESWKTGTLDIENRVRQMFKELLADNRQRKQFQNKIKVL